MSKLTTARHVDVFKKEVLFWIEKWGLHEWEPRFSHEECENDLAALRFNICGRVATFILATEWKRTAINNYQIKVCAKHEAIELLLAESHGIAIARYVTEDEFLSAHHALVRRLEKLL